MEHISHLLPVLYIVSIVCMGGSQSPDSSNPLLPPCYPYICSLHLCLYFSFADKIIYTISPGFPGGAVVKNPPANAGDTGSIPGSGRYPEEGNGILLQYPCLGNPMDRGAWRATAHGVTKSQA